MSIVTIVKNDSVYKRIKTIFSDYDVLRNVSHFQELTNYILAEEIALVIIDETIHWETRAKQYLSEHSVSWVTFNGNFDDLKEKVMASLYSGYEETIPTPKIDIAKEEVLQEETVQEEVKFERVKRNLEKEPIQQEIYKPTPPPILPAPQIKYVDRVVEKVREVKVDRVVETIKEVPVERIVEIVRNQVVEVKPNFDEIDLDMSPQEFKETKEKIAPVIIQESEHIGPRMIGLMGAEEDIDISNNVFLIANSIAALGYKVLVIADGREEINALEDMAFAKEKEDEQAELFEHEEVFYMRQNVKWDYAEILNMNFTHIVFWYDPITTTNGFKQMDNWTRTHYPFLISSGVKWKAEELIEILNDIDSTVLNRTHVLLKESHKEVVKKLNDYYPELNINQLPKSQDPFSPEQESLEWASLQFVIQKRRSINYKLWLMLTGAIVISAACVWLGLQIDVPIGVGGGS